MTTNVVLPRSIATTVTTAGALAAGKHARVDATSGPLTMTLPAASAGNAGTSLSVEKIDTSTNAVTVSGSIRGATSTLTIAWQFETIEFIADATGSWYPTAGHKTKAALDAAYDAKGAAAAVTPASLGLGNVSNTSDANKPVSSAQQAALNLKVNTADISATVVPADIGAEPAISTGTTGQFWRGDKTWQPVPAPVVTPNVQGGSYTVVLSDAGKVIEFTGSSAAFFVIPANASVPFPVGTVIEVFQAGTGQVNIGGATIRSRSGLYNTAGQYASAAVRQRAIDEWVLTGDVA